MLILIVFCKIIYNASVDINYTRIVSNDYMYNLCIVICNIEKGQLKEWLNEFTYYLTQAVDDTNSGTSKPGQVSCLDIKT